jgi:hypothetical protein
MPRINGSEMRARVVIETVVDTAEVSYIRRAQ